MMKLREVLKTPYGAVVETDIFKKTTKNSLSGKKRKVSGKLRNIEGDVDVGNVLATVVNDTNIAYKHYADDMKIYQTWYRNEQMIAAGKARKNPVSDAQALKAVRDMLEDIGSVWVGLRESYNIGYVILDEAGYVDERAMTKNANTLKRAIKTGDVDKSAEAIAELIKANPEMAIRLQTYGIRAAEVER